MAVVALPFRDCSPATPSIAVNTVYGQLAPPFLNFTLVGSSSVQIDYSSNTSLLSTILSPTSVLTFTLNPNSSQSFCRTARPPSPLANISSDPNNPYCPIAPGPVAFAVGTGLDRSYELTTLTTQIRVLDTSNPAQQLACINVDATPLRPTSSVYGHAAIVFWFSVALALAYWLVIGLARLSAAWNRGRQRVHSDLWSRVQGLGFVLASAVSGERFADFPALLRYGTPSMRDVIFHTQWCTLLGMLSVQWPRFAYPFFAQTAWATLLYNISITQGPDAQAKHWDPLHADPFSPPQDFADQIADPTSPLFLNTTIPNTLFTLPTDRPTTGIPALAASVGIRPQDTFDIAALLFILIIAGTVLLSLLIFAIDSLTASIRTPPKEFTESPEPTHPDDHRPAGWLAYRLGQSSFHSAVLHGNLVRILTLFHFPVSTFACYQFASGRTYASLSSLVLAALFFALFSLVIPVSLLLRLATTPTAKLYDETRTLLMLGPLYNHYTHGSQLFVALFFATNIVYALALGCGQQSGSAQAIIMLVVEVAVALTTSVWLPWGRGAAMGGINFMFSVARIITAVLLVILSPVVSVGSAAGGWIAYAILVIQALTYLFLLLMFLAKLAEGVVRIVWDVPFDRSKHTVDAGFLGALGLAECCGGQRTKGRDSGRKRNRRRDSGNADGSHSPSSSTSSVASASHALADTARTRTRARSRSTTQMLPMHVHANAAAAQSHTTVPSVLRPEQLNQPYKEESDDEGGYILGAWHYDDEPGEGPSPPISPGVAAVMPATPAETSSPTPGAAAGTKGSSGFSRVAGGRANLESPFTMAAGAVAAGKAATHPRGSSYTALSSRSSGSEKSGVSSSHSNVQLLPIGASNSQIPPVGTSNAYSTVHLSPLGMSNAHPPLTAQLPPGAMAPVTSSHARQNSHSAIIERANNPNPNTPNPNPIATSNPNKNAAYEYSRTATATGAATDAASTGNKGRGAPEQLLHAHAHAHAQAHTYGGGGSSDSEIVHRDAYYDDVSPRPARAGEQRRRRRWLGFGLFVTSTTGGASSSPSLPAGEQAVEARAWGRRGESAAAAAPAAVPMLRPNAEEAASASASASQLALAGASSPSNSRPPSPGAAGASSAPPSGSRTFVVIRDRRPSLRPSPLSQTHTHIQDVPDSVDTILRSSPLRPERFSDGDAGEPSSLAVVRPNRTSASSSPLAGVSSSSSLH